LIFRKSGAAIPSAPLIFFQVPSSTDDAVAVNQLIKESGESNGSPLLILDYAPGI
jgi:hypothetical protein